MGSEYYAGSRMVTAIVMWIHSSSFFGLCVEELFCESVVKEFYCEKNNQLDDIEYSWYQFSLQLETRVPSEGFYYRIIRPLRENQVFQVIRHVLCFWNFV
jgi:hypothetical protein